MDKPDFLVKRAFDMVVALVLFVVTLPLMGWISWRIRRESPGSVIFRQTRIGRYGRPFVLYKFRTMVEGAEKLWVAPQTTADLEHYRFQDDHDARITPFGRFLRNTSLDELPQLVNVLKGEMSLVGPRPEIPEIVLLYPPEAHRRHRCLPGLTGLAQVMGRGDLTTQESLRYDLQYCQEWSLGLDLKILWLTVRAVFKRQGAY